MLTGIELVFFIVANMGFGYVLQIGMVLLLQSSAHTALQEPRYFLLLTSSHQEEGWWRERSWEGHSTFQFGNVLLLCYMGKSMPLLICGFVVVFFFNADLFNFFHSDVPASALGVLTVP